MKKWQTCRVCLERVRVKRLRGTGGVRADRHGDGSVGCEPCFPIFFVPRTVYIPAQARMGTVFS